MRCGYRSTRRLLAKQALVFALTLSTVSSGVDGVRLRAAGGGKEGTVSVASDPVGAAVYVDGEFVGRAPIQVKQLAAGDHRVRVVKDGFLENGRVVSVDAGSTKSVLIRMTAGTAVRAAGAPQMAFRIVVLEGEDGVNIIDKMTAVQPVVEVVDRNNLPVAGVAVVFLLRGNNATFANGARQLAVTTDTAGRATASGLSPVGKGSFDIQVRASFQGQNATATIHQTNLPTSPSTGQAASQAGAAAAGGAAAGAGAGAAAGAAGGGAGGGGGLSGLAIAGIVGGAAAGGLIAVKAATGGSSSTPPGNVPNAAPCSQPTVAGGDTPETHVVELGKSSGTFNFFFNTQNVPDRLVVTYEGKTLFDTGCVGSAGSKSLSYSGKSTQVTVTITPNCAGGTTGTAWDYSISCPL